MGSLNKGEKVAGLYGTRTRRVYEDFDDEPFGVQLKAINGRPDQSEGFVPGLSGAKEDPTADHDDF